MSAVRTLSATLTDTASVSTTTGSVRGRETDDAQVFLSIPYAAPPTGAGRFAPPRPHERWSRERDAREPGPTAPQPDRSRIGNLDLSPFFGAGWVPGDDYLTVNIWTPRIETTKAPVILYVHGGAFIAGSSHAPAYSGSAFARDGAVFVTINYRLGIAGFLHLPDAPDNRGLLDIIAALEWVHDNAAAFGGDPDNVTLMGQSAGAIIVSGLLSTPAAAGLFRRAIVQSGSGSGAFTREQASLVTSAVSDLLGIEATASSLQGLDDSMLVDLVPRLVGVDLTTATARDPLGGITAFSLVLDKQPADAVTHASGRLPDLLIGSNRDEGALYIAPHGRLAESTESDLVAAAARFTSDPASEVARYRAALPGASRADLRVAILSDGMFRDGTRLLADAHRRRADSSTFVYEFGWKSNALDAQLGSSHLMELPFVFDCVDVAELHGPNALLGTAPIPAGLADHMHAAWVRFAAEGTPGWPAQGAEPSPVHVIGVPG